MSIMHLSMTKFNIKVQLSWEGHKNVRNRPYGFKIHYVNVKTMRMIVQIFVAFSEKLNFNVVVIWMLIEMAIFHIVMVANPDYGIVTHSKGNTF